jgi:hypothetical protein
MLMVGGRHDPYYFPRRNREAFMPGYHCPNAPLTTESSEIQFQPFGRMDMPSWATEKEGRA